jgi:hypothetical protein
VVSNVDDYKKFVPACVDSKVLKRYEGTKMEAELSVGYGPANERYISKINFEPQKYVEVKTSYLHTFIPSYTFSHLPPAHIYHFCTNTNEPLLSYPPPSLLLPLVSSFFLLYSGQSGFFISLSFSILEVGIRSNTRQTQPMFSNISSFLCFSFGALQKDDRVLIR